MQPLRFISFPLAFPKAWKKLAREVGCILVLAFNRRKYRPGRSCLSTRKILLVCHDAEFYGAQILALNIARVLRNEFCFTVTTVLLGAGPLRDQFAAIGPVLDLGNPTWRECFGLVEGYRRQLELRQLAREGYMYAICNSVATGNLMPLLQAEGFKTIGLVHELPQFLQKFGLLDAAKQFATQSSRVVFPAPFVRDQFISFVAVQDVPAVVRPQGLFRINPYGCRKSVARDLLLKRLKLDADCSLVVAAGSSDLRKGMDLFVEIALKVISLNQQVHFIWVGSDQTETAIACMNIVTQAGAENRIHFTGILGNPDDYAQVMAGADVFVLTSREDPFPSVVLDAMSVSVPVVGFAGAGGFESILQEGAGLLAPMENCEIFARHIYDLLSQPQRASEIGATGAKIISTRYRFSEYVRDLLGLLGLQAPRVSVLVPSHNSAHYLPARIESILKQSYKPFEIIFLDDASSDDSVAIARSYLATSSIDFTLEVNECTAGHYAQWLKGLARVAGDIIWVAEADHRCEPTWLESLIVQFEDPEITIVTHLLDKLVNETIQHSPSYNSIPIETSYIPGITACQRDGPAEIRENLSIYNLLPRVSAVLMRRFDIDDNLREAILSSQYFGDWLLYLNALERGKVAFVPLPLNPEDTQQGIVYAGADRADYFAELVIVQEFVCKRYSLSADILERIKESRQSAYLSLGLATDEFPLWNQHPAFRHILKNSDEVEDLGMVNP
jgi:O-antigen biosynthesis protein